MFEIELIVSEPPWPSSALLIRRVEDIIALNYEAEGIVLRITACDNIKVCTPEKVAELAGLDSDLEIIKKILQRRRENFEGLYHAADLWCPELETQLDILREAAEGLSLLMTPVLVIQKGIKSHGKCPNPCELDEWIRKGLERNR
jgi:hypothetical protein